MRLLSLFSACLLSGSTCLAAQHDEREGLGDQSLVNATESYSENEILRRNADFEARLAQTPVQGVRKMSSDEGEKFFLDYWKFLDDSQSASSARENGENTQIEEPLSDNTTFGLESRGNYEFVFPRHFPPESSLPQEADSNGLLGRRDFKCPTDTYACTSINRSDRCCGTRDICQIVKDTGSGDVGCCRKGLTCSSQVGLCPAKYETCSQELGGGCCIPGYQCVSGGCAYVAVITVTVHSSVILSTVTYSTSPHTLTSTTASVHTTETQTTNTNDLVPPARPTSLTTATHATTSRNDVCPTGFYACSAVYHGGCCQTGRNCDTTSCPTVASTTVVSNGVTVVEPVATGESGRSGSCAGGWFECAAAEGGGCCPLGFACGASCTATRAMETTVAKEQATATGGGGKQMNNGGLGLVVGIGMGIWAL